MTNNFVDHGENVTLVPKQLVRQVRRFVQDYVEVNELFEGEETSDQQIAAYMVDEIQTWNYTPPIIMSAEINAVSLVAVPTLGSVRKWIIDATSARVMKSVLFKMARNDMPYTSGNVTIQPNAVWRNMQPIIQDLELQYKEFRDRYKIAKNADAAYGVAYSELYVGVYDNREGYLVVQI